jgi:hypothetical protein
MPRYSNISTKGLPWTDYDRVCLNFKCWELFLILHDWKYASSTNMTCCEPRMVRHESRNNFNGLCKGKYC